MTNPTPDKRFNIITLPCGKEQPPCCPVKLNVACGHGERGYILSVPSKPTSGKRHVLQVLADSVEDAVTADEASRLRELIRVDLISTSCKKGYPSAIGPGPWKKVSPNTSTDVWPAVSIVGPEVRVVNAAPFAVDAFSRQIPPLVRGDYPIMGVMDFLNTFLLPAQPQTYGVAVRCCDGTDHFVADVEVFPAQEWIGTLSFKYAPPPSKFEAIPFANPGRRNRGHLKEIRTRQFTASCSIHAKYLNEEISVEFPPKTEILKKVTEILSKVSDVEALAGKANKLSNISGVFKISYPSVTLTGNVKRKENKGEWSVGYGGKVSLQFQPLIGMKAEVDILDALIAAAATAGGVPWLSSVVLRAKKAAAEGGICEVSLKLSGGTDIVGSLDWEGAEKLSPKSGKFGFEFSLKIEGLVATANDYFEVAAGASVGGESKFSVLMVMANDKELEFTPELKWSGVTVFYGAFIQRTKGTKFSSAPTIKDQMKNDEGKIKRKAKIQLVEAWSDPPQSASFGEKSAKNPTSLGGFLQ